VIATACTLQEKSKPILPPQKMEAVLLDMLLTQSYSTHYQGIINEQQMDSITQWIMHKHKIDTSVFFASYNYYIDRPELLDSMLSDIHIKVTQLHTVKDSILPIEERILKNITPKKHDKIRQSLQDIVQLHRQ